MIYLEPGLNDVILTVSENTMVTDTKYLFQFENVMTSEEVLFTTDDISTNRLRYDHFLITLTASGATGGIDVPLNLTPGQWNYNIWEGPTFSTIDISLYTNIVESGKMVVNNENDVITLGYTNSVYI